MNAKVIPGSMPGTFHLLINGWFPAMKDESFGVASAVAVALNHPDKWEPSEAYEVADQIRYHFEHSSRIVKANEIRATGPKWDRWPASLPQVSYVTADSSFLCVTCANNGNGSEASTITDNPQWQIVGAQVNEDDTECAHCGRMILGVPK